ncbi:MAG: type I 3-dehydroquinate dehydratase, partial [Candidatus Methanomethylophilaceae archaeon]|nr:type I 3-dehydroquinate dehydratase [Candidatus Methanomethylophilaceae archaeon]
MTICASLSEPDDVRNIGPADMVEVRTDLFDKVPEGIGADLLVTFRRDFDESYLPKGFSGTVDVGTGPRPPGGYRTVGSYHDYESTPSADKIAAILNSMDADVRKGAFAANSIEDLVNIRQAADMVHRPHVILGMGELGTVTRIRQRILGNEFTFGYVGEPTAPGQLSVEEMSRLGDDCTILGIFGHPLSKSLSPRMQNRALEVSGIPGIYLKFDDIDVSHAAELIRGYDIRGANVTVPHKETVMDQMDRISDEVDAIGAMNTIVNDGGRLTGRNTDIAGIGIALDNAGFSPAGKSAAILGSGGSARACAYFLSKKGCELTITGRNRKTVERLA